jgi:hypothetical protein
LNKTCICGEPFQISRFLKDFINDSLLLTSSKSLIRQNKCDFMALSYRILLRKEPEGDYTVVVPSLPGCVTYGDTIEESITWSLD